MRECINQLHKFVPYAASDDFTLDITGLVTVVAANITQLTTKQQNGLKQAIEKHNAGGTWASVWSVTDTGDKRRDGQVQKMDLFSDVNSKQLAMQRAAPVKAAAVPFMPNVLKASVSGLQVPAAEHGHLIDWLKTLMAAVPVEDKIRQLVSLSSADQQAVLAAATNVVTKRQRDSAVTEPVGKKPKLTVRDAIETAKEALTVMEGKPAPDGEVLGKERNKLYNALVASVNHVCAGEEVNMKHVTSCFNRGAKHLSDGQFKYIRKRVADDKVTALKWTKVLTGLDHTSDLAEKAKQKKQQQLERQQQQAKQTKKKARLSGGGGGGFYSDHLQSQQAPSYSSHYFAPQQQQQLGMPHQQQMGMQQQQLPPSYMPPPYHLQQSLGMLSPPQYPPVDTQQQSLGMLNSNLQVPATHMSSLHANHTQAW